MPLPSQAHSGPASTATPKSVLPSPTAKSTAQSRREDDDDDDNNDGDDDDADNDEDNDDDNKRALATKKDGIKSSPTHAATVVSSSSTSSSSSNVANAPPLISESRTVISSNLMRTAIHAHLCTLFHPNTVQPINTITLSSLLTTLILNHQNIYEMENINGFPNLTYLSLNNNKISYIHGLEHVPLLTKLDLSFNRIKKIENISHLTHLTDLSLSYNLLTEISSLHTQFTVTAATTTATSTSAAGNGSASSSASATITNTAVVAATSTNNNNNNTSSTTTTKTDVGLIATNHPKLTVLSLGNNNISTLLSNVQQIRPFKTIRVLVLKGNPISHEDEYKSTVYALLPQLTYFDYIRLDATLVQSARDKMLDTLLIMESTERNLEEDRILEFSNKNLEIEKLNAHIDGLLQLIGHFNPIPVVTSVTNSSNNNNNNNNNNNKDNNTPLPPGSVGSASDPSRIKILPGFNQLYQQYITNFTTIILPFEQEILLRKKEKLNEYNMFLFVLNKLRSENEMNSRILIESFLNEKIEAINALRLSNNNNNNNNTKNNNNNTSVSNTSNNNNITGVIEIYTTKLNDLITILMNDELKLVQQSYILIEEFDKNYTNLINLNTTKFSLIFRKFTELTQSFHTNLTDLCQTILEKLNKPISDDTQNNNASGTPPQTSGGHTTTSATTSNDNNTLSSSMFANINEFQVNEIRNLLLDKDSINTILATFSDNTLTRLSNREDDIREREESEAKRLLNDIRVEEMSRNRVRVQEIEEIRIREENALKNLGQ